MRVQARELARGQQTEPPEQAATRRAELGAFVALATRNKKSTVRGEHATRRFKLAHTRSLLQERREQEGATARAARGKASLLMSQQVVAQHRAKQAARVAVLMEQGRKASEAAVRMHAIRERQAAEVRERKAKGRRVIRETHHARLAYYDLVRKPRPPADSGTARRRARRAARWTRARGSPRSRSRRTRLRRSPSSCAPPTSAPRACKRRAASRRGRPQSRATTLHVIGEYVKWEGSAALPRRRRGICLAAKLHGKAGALGARLPATRRGHAGRPTLRDAAEWQQP